METKVCIRCELVKSLSEFYAHPKMEDGHLNKCKTCCKKEAALNYKKKSKNVWFIESERRRQREKYARLNYKEKYPPNIFQVNSKTKNLHRNLRVAGYDMYMKEAHHWNYNLPNQGFILTRKYHKLIHKYLSFDAKTKCFKWENKVLDTIEKHHDFIKSVFNENNIDSSIIEFSL